MKRSINIFSLALLVLGLGLLFYLFRAPTTADAAFTGMPLNQPQRVDFRIDKYLWDKKSSRERLDQARDWLLYTTVSQSGRSTKELSDIFFDLPSSRHQYLRQVANFEYGETRSRLIGDGEVVALIPANSANRIDQLAHIADEHRKNSGAKPKDLLVFEYELKLDGTGDQPYGTITRRDAIAGDDLFTEKYGYVEATVKSTADLKTFISRIDDIVFAQDEGGALLVGGRKIQGSQYHGISVEDIAAIWQSENEIQSKKNEITTKWKKEVDDFKNSWSKQTYSNPMERARLEATMDEAWKGLQARQEAEAKGSHLVLGSGFSLDPSYHFDDLKKTFSQFIVPLFSLDDVDSTAPSPRIYPNYRFPFPQPAAGTSHSTAISEVESGFDKCDIEPFFDWLEEHRSSSAKKVELIEKLFEGADSPEAQVVLAKLHVPFAGFVVDQRARYDGTLENTEVGMILFYTDLVAKLWDFDYKGSAPRTIEDFRSEREILQHTSPAFLEQSKNMPYARLWFGPDTRGYQSLEKGQSLVFGRKATRLFAKSHSSISGRGEVEPDSSTAMFINWWDDHFEEVARYEPQYQRLNEIMKWSLVITWLNQADHGADLGFLNANSVPVNRSHRFPDWVKQQPDLRFNQWTDDMFLKRTDRCTSTEILPKLRSEEYTQSGDKTDDEHKRLLIGGVSLSSEEVFAGRTLLSAETRVSNQALRSGLDLAPLKSGENTLQLIEGSSFKFQNLARDKVLITSTPKTGSMLRTPYGDLAPESFEHVLASRESAITVQSKYGQTEIGSLTIQRTKNAFSVGWESRELDLGQALARDLSGTTEPAKLLASDSMVESAIEFENGQGFLVKLKNSNGWMRFKPEGKASATITEGWQARFADIESSAKPIDVAWWDQGRVTTELGDGYVLLRTTAPAENGFILEATHGLPQTGTKPVTLMVGEQKVGAVIDSETGSLWVRYSELPESLRGNPGSLQKALSADLAKPGFAADGVIRLRDPAVLRADPMPELLSGGYEKAAQKLIESPENFARSLEQHFTNALKEADEALAVKDYESLVPRLDRLIEVYGPRPELTLRKGVALIEKGRVNEAAKALNESIAIGSDRTALFNELNSRLAGGSLKSDNAIQLSLRGEEIATHGKVSSLSSGTKVNPETIDLDSAFLYMQDGAGLDKVNWSVGAKKAMNQLVSGELADVIKLPKGDLSKFKPIEVYVGDSKVTLRAVSETTTSYNLRIPITAGLQSKCDNGQSSFEDCGDVYVIVPRKE
jgi:hypothetical protein